MHNTVGDVTLTNISRETNDFQNFVQYPKTKVLCLSSSSGMFLARGEGGGRYSHIVWVGCAAGLSYPLLDQILQILWPHTSLKMLNCSWFQCFVSDPVKRDPILDQFSIITRPYTRQNGLKTIPVPAAHTCIANIWEYPPGGFLASL